MDSTGARWHAFVVTSGIPADGQGAAGVPLALDPALEEFARTRATLLGTDTRVVRVDLMQAGPDSAVLLLTLAGPPRQLVLKVAGPQADPGVDFERTASVSALARAAGAPVATALAADMSYRAGPWNYLLQEHVDGVEWRRVRPQLEPEQVTAAHRQIAAAVLAVQSVRLSSFGELNSAGEPACQDLVSALRRRAELRIRDESRRAVFSALLDREAHLLSDRQQPTLCHDDLHHDNLIFQPDRGGWRLVGLLDWDKAWAGPAESDIARMAFWDDMTGPGFWESYDALSPPRPGRAERALVYQLLWCLEYDVDTPRHLADTAALCRRLGLKL